jgi:carboxymethylenebutenolidase
MRNIYSGRAAQRPETALTSLGVAHDVREYETLGHGFLNELPRFMQSGLNPMNLVLNIHLRDETAIADAWKRIFAFFDTHVRGAQN